MEYDRKLFSILAGVILLFTSLGDVGAAHAAGGAAPESATSIPSTPGDSFINDGIEYQWRPDLRAVSREAGIALPREGHKPTEAGEAMEVKEILGEKGRYKIYRPVLSRVPAGSAIQEVLHNRRTVSTFPIVSNKITKQYGIVTDDLLLRLKDLSQAGDIAREYGIDLSYTSEPIQTAFYKIVGEVDIRELRERLLTDPRVERVTLDIIDRIRRPR